MFYDDVDIEHLEEVYKLPAELLPLVKERPRMLPGESEADYDAMFDSLVDDTHPSSGAEWLVAIDVAHLCWEIRRYRRWKDVILSTYREDGLKAVLRKTNPAAMVEGSEAAIRAESELEAELWRKNSESRSAINARLESRGYGEEAITVAAFIESLPSLANIERFLVSARQQRNEAMRNIRISREFALRIRKYEDEQQLKLVHTKQASATEVPAARNQVPS